MRDLPQASGKVLENWAEALGAKRRVETDDELRSRLRGQLVHCLSVASLGHADWVVSEAIHAHLPIGVDDEDVKALLARRWLRDESRRLTLWQRFRWWWRLWWSWR